MRKFSVVETAVFGSGSSFGSCDRDISECDAVLAGQSTSGPDPFSG